MLDAVVVCHCNVVRDGDIAALVDAGVRTVDELTASCGAGGKCGSCVDLLARMLDAVQGSDVAA